MQHGARAMQATDQADKWYVYNGVIPKESIKAVDYNPNLPDEPPAKTEEELFQIAIAEINSKAFLKQCHRKR